MAPNIALKMNEFTLKMIVFFKIMDKPVKLQ